MLGLSNRNLLDNAGLIHTLELPRQTILIPRRYAIGLRDHTPGRIRRGPSPEGESVAEWFGRFALTDQAGDIMGETEERLEKLVDYYLWVGEDRISAQGIVRLLDRGVGREAVKRWMKPEENGDPQAEAPKFLTDVELRKLYHWERPEIPSLSPADQADTGLAVALPELDVAVRPGV